MLGAAGCNLAGVLDHWAEAAGEPLSQFIGQFKAPDYHLDLEAAYRYLFRRFCEKGGPDAFRVSFDDFLQGLASQKTDLARYPESTMGSLECRAIFREYFVGRGVPAQKSMVITANNGFKSLLCAALASVMTEDHNGVRHPIGGELLAARGHYHSLVAFPCLFGGDLRVIPDMRAATVARELAKDTGNRIRALALFAVDNPTGRIYDEDEMTELAGVLAAHNKRFPEKPVRVIADDVYAGSLLCPQTKMPRAFAAMANEGRSMHDCTISIGSMSKTFAFASSRIGFATSGDKKLMISISAWMLQTGAYHIPPFLEVAAAAALAAVPRSWVEDNNKAYRSRLASARDHLATLNSRLNCEIKMNDPKGGWYLLLDVPRSALSPNAQLNIQEDELHAYLLLYGKMPGKNHCRPNTGVATFPGSINGISNGVHNDPNILTMRLSLAMSEENLSMAFERIGDAIEQLNEARPSEISDVLDMAKHSVEHSEFRLDRLPDG